MFSEEATSALAGFQGGPLAFGDVGFCGGRKTGEPGENPSEHGENQQQTQPKQALSPPRPRRSPI